MDLDNVSFLFDREEMILLLRLLKCENIPFPSQEDGIDAEAALERLRADRLVSGSVRAVVVDQIISFLLLSMDRAPFRLYASGDGCAAIFKTAAVSIVLRKRGERWVIAPFQAFGHAREAMLDSLRGLRGPCTLTAGGKEGVEQLSFKSAEEAAKAAEKLLPLEKDGV